MYLTQQRLRNIQQLETSAINLHQPELNKVHRKKARTSRRDFFQNKPLKPNMLQYNQIQQDYLQMQEQNHFSARQVNPQPKQQSSPFIYRRSHRRNKTTNNLKSKQKSLQKFQNKSIEKPCNNYHQEESPSTLKINNFIFDVDDQQEKKQDDVVLQNKEHPEHNMKIQTENLFSHAPANNTFYTPKNRNLRKLHKFDFSQKNQFFHEKQEQDNNKSRSVSIRPRRKYQQKNRQSASIQGNASQRQLLNQSPKIKIDSFVYEESPQKKELQSPKKAAKKSVKVDISQFNRMKIHRQKNWNKEKYILYSDTNKNFLFSAFVESRDAIYIYDRHGDYQSGDPYILKMEANFMGTLINIFTYGIINKEQTKNKGFFKKRQLYATIQSDSPSLLDEVKPREFTVYFLKSTVNLQELPVHLKQTPLNKLYMESDHYKKYIHCFRNKQPKWDQKQKVHVLDMYNRAEQASVKNFILLDENQADCIIFGKYSKNTFNLDCRPNFPSILAFSFSLSSFLYRNW